MGQRLALQSLLEEILGSRNVYFQPPANLVMNYPAIVYKRDYRTVQHADNVPYHNRKRYQVTYIDKNPDSDVPDKISELPLCRYDRSFPAENLNHDVYSLYF